MDLHGVRYVVADVVGAQGAWISLQQRLDGRRVESVYFLARRAGVSVAVVEHVDAAGVDGLCCVSVAHTRQLQ